MRLTHLFNDPKQNSSVFSLICSWSGTPIQSQTILLPFFPLLNVESGLTDPHSWCLHSHCQSLSSVDPTLFLLGSNQSLLIHLLTCSHSLTILFHPCQSFSSSLKTLQRLLTALQSLPLLQTPWVLQVPLRGAVS